MDNDYWLTKWKVSEIGFNQSKPHPLLIKYFDTLNLALGARIFVPLCGKSIDMLWLLKQGYQVVGIDVSHIACKAFFLENQLTFDVIETETHTLYHHDNVTLICGDFFNLSEKMLGPVDAVYDRAALIALPCSTRASYVTHLLKLLPLIPPIFLITLEYDQSQMKGPPFSVPECEVYSLYDARYKPVKLEFKALTKISPHLKEKGLAHAFESAFWMT
ncbi:MAG: thiopurine S-methyltransferase [Legionellaceae bacterium]|nr:thiopurine S-methyltransferase [Legionellaceae bacterium]